MPEKPIKDSELKEESIDLDEIVIDESDLIEGINEIPPNFLQNITFVLSGDFESISREKLEILIT